MLRKVITQIDRPGPDLVERYRRGTSGLLAMRLGNSQVMDRAIQPLFPEWHVCGPAFTVKLDYVDILMPAAAADLCEPGDVIVIANQGRPDAAVWGMSLTKNAAQRGAAGVIVDGVVEIYNPHGIARPLEGDYNEVGFPVFARGTVPNAGTFTQPGSINVPVACGGVVVCPGDLILANKHVICVVPKDEIAPMIDGLEQYKRDVTERQARAAAENRSLFERRDGRKMIEDSGVAWID